jgi:YVTN family beta-propeller protein
MMRPTRPPNGSGPMRAPQGLTRRQLVGRLAAAGFALPLVGALGREAALAQEGRWVQAPALPGAAQPISPQDRVYTADQTSNTVSVIDPSTNTLVGTIPLGSPQTGSLFSAVYYGEIDVHGLGFAPDGSLLNVISITSNAVYLIDPATNLPVGRTYVARSPHEGFISPDGKEVWVAVRGENYVSVLDVARMRAAGAAQIPAPAGMGGVGVGTPAAGEGIELARIPTGNGPGMVIFSPDGTIAYVNHSESAQLVKVDVRTRQVVGRIEGLVSPFSPNLAASPDGSEVWLTHKDVGKVTAVDANAFKVLTVLDTGRTTNHVNFVSKADATYAYVTVGGLDQVKAYRLNGESPELVATIATSGSTPHGIWPSPDNTRVYVGLENGDAVDVIDTDSHDVVTSIPIGQNPMALVYVAGAVRQGTGEANLSQQGLNLRVQTFDLQLEGGGTALVFVRELPLTDQISVVGYDMPPGAPYTLFAGDGAGWVALSDLVVMPSGGAAAVLNTDFFDQFDRFLLLPKGQAPG